MRLGAQFRRLGGLILFFPLTVIEAGLFPMVQGFRNALIVLGLTVVAAVVFKVLGRHARTDRALTARETGFHH
ncbi:MAG: hypothetical protein H6745_17400 [Deltaproteobacteria bacterium]|nr:hypothetical protein [Deltaproteobacteria bacterium]